MINVVEGGPNYGLKEFEVQPRTLCSHISASEDGIRSISLTNRKKLYNYRARANLVQSSFEITRLLALNLCGNHVKLENVATEFLTLGYIGKPMSHRFERNRRAIRAHHNLLKLLELAQLVKSCTRNGKYKEAAAVVLNHRLVSGESLNWLLADLFSEASEAALTLRIITVELLHKLVPLPEAIGNTLWLRFLDVNSPCQNKFFTHAHHIQSALRQEGFLLCQSNRKMNVPNHHVTNKVCRVESYCIASVSSGRLQWLEMCSRFHAIFFLQKPDVNSLKSCMNWRHRPSLLLVSWLFRHVQGASNAFESAVLGITGTALQSTIDACMHLSGPLSHVGGSFVHSNLPESILVKLRSMGNDNVSQLDPSVL